ncbi:DUF4081 domain-containing GNAT family N-acetyltransferase [Dermatophilus congolensis]|uniref:GNAT family N-acetyltransferase n=2 Tax=Dermatophilus congolensis TaxID=1863 RepID=UPI001FBB6ECC|nr:DUF4081 domain-containing GNAT family N-acetyltransferase [Dermatophilus congolensis]
MTPMLWTSRTVRSLGRGDIDEALELLAKHPVENVYLAARLQELDLSRGEGHALVYAPKGRIEAVCWMSANIVPSAGSIEGAVAFGGRLRRHQQRFSSIFGPADVVTALWSQIQAFWRPPIEERLHQRLMAVGPEKALTVTPDKHVRVAHPDELDIIVPAAEAMFIEEIGYAPYSDYAGSLSYRSANLALIRRGHTLAAIEDSQVIFKAEFGSVALGACQLQGVWVTPTRRGQGVAVPALAACVEYARAHVAPVVTLYVNDYNVPAVAAYRRVGFEEVGEFATVLL